MLKYRPTNSNDKDLLASWIAADPEHKAKENCTPDFWLTPPQDSESFVAEDATGPIFFVRSETLRRLHIQFAPQNEWKRLAVALDLFVKDMKATGAGHVRQFIFDSVYKPLIKFLSRRGVRPSPNEFVLDL
jgi:hypothetical protein